MCVGRSGHTVREDDGSGGGQLEDSGEVGSH